MKLTQTPFGPAVVVVLMLAGTAIGQQSWPQLKFDGRHSGDVPDGSVTVPLGLIGAVPLTDAVLTAPVVADGRVYAVDGAGVAFAIDAATLKVVWKRKTSGGPANCNNVSSPAIAGKYLHFGTMAGSYYVLDASSGKLVKEIRCGQPIFSSPVVANRLDNGGRVDVLRIGGGEVQKDHVPGTQTSTRGGLLSFCSVSLRGRDVYRCRPEEDFGLCKHSPDRQSPEYLGGAPSIASPILLGENAVYGGLDGRLHVVPLSGRGKAWSFKTALGKAISAPAAVCDGRVYFGCDDGYLYVLGPAGKAPLPTEDLGLWKVRSPLGGKYTDPKYDWYTSFADWGNTNAGVQQAVKPPFRIKWIRRFEGTTKHFSTCGGGRMYTHTAEGRIFAVEQETGRLLWRRYSPGVHICYTSPLYYKERLLVPQAGLCLMDGTLYYSCFFGYLRKGTSGSRSAAGITAAMDPAVLPGEEGRVLWSTTEHAVHSGCTISAKDGRLYMGGYSRVDDKTNRVWCLSAKDGSLIWQSDPVDRAIHVITVGDRFLFTHAQYNNGYLIDKQTGKILHTLTKGYKCTRFTLSEPYLLGANMDVYDLSDPADIKLLSTGPAVDPSQCLGAIVSSGRIFYTSHGSGLQISQVYGAEAASPAAPWKTTPRPQRDP